MTTFIDLDLRPDQWEHPLAFGLRLRRVLPLCDVIIGTEEEFWAALSPKPEAVMAGQSATDEESLHALMLACGRENDAALVLKRGERGVRLYVGGAHFDVPGFPVEIVNTVGAGDGFARRLDIWLGPWLGLARGRSFRQCLWRAGGVAAWLRARSAQPEMRSKPSSETKASASKKVKNPTTEYTEF